MDEIARRVRRTLAWAGRALLALPFVYLTAGLIGGCIPANIGWTPPAQGIRMFVEDNGIHTGLVLPVAAAGVDWRATFPAGDIADPRYAAFDWVSVGWGDRAFYVETPNWSDVRPLTVFGAALGSTRTVLHVEHVDQPQPGSAVRAITVTPDQYLRIVAYVRASMGPGGKVAGGYGANDVFYDGRGTYSALATCNEWTGRALRIAGVRTGIWTPFPVDVMAWL